MKVFLRIHLINVLVLFCSVQAICQVKPSRISVVAVPQQIPVIKGLKVNPILKLMVDVSTGKAPEGIQSIRCNVAAVSDIERIDVYQTGATPFTDAALVGTTTPVQNKFSIPINTDLHPGLQFLWISVVLKNEANPDGLVDLRCESFISKSGKRTRIILQDGDYRRRIAIAVRRVGDDGIHTYRIPGITQTDKGTLLAVYDIRYNSSRDLPGHIDVGLSRSVDGGRSWEPMKVIMSMGGAGENSGIGDPAILFDPVTKTTWVAALWSKGNRSIAGSIGGISPDSTGQFMLTKSEDDGMTWSGAINITPQVKRPEWKIFFQGPGGGIAMNDGTLVFPAQYWDKGGKPFSTIVYSSDHGSSWNGKLDGPKSNTTESQVIEVVDGTLMLNMRDNRGKYRSVATTTDMGKTWTEHITSYNALPDPVCMASIIKASVPTKQGLKEVLFFSNPATHAGRFDMTVKASTDNGNTWQKLNSIMIDERELYGYSSLTAIDSETIGLLYEGAGDLYFVRLPVNAIIKKW